MKIAFAAIAFLVISLAIWTAWETHQISQRSSEKINSLTSRIDELETNIRDLATLLHVTTIAAPDDSARQSAANAQHRVRSDNINHQLINQRQADSNQWQEIDELKSDYEFQKKEIDKIQYDLERIKRELREIDRK